MKTPTMTMIKDQAAQSQRFLDDLQVFGTTFEECSIIQVSNESGRFSAGEECKTRIIQDGEGVICITLNVHGEILSYSCPILNDDEARAKRLAKVSA